MKNIILKMFVLCIVFGLSFSVVEANIFTDIGEFFGITGHAVSGGLVCGNGIKETGEVCDITDFGGINCNNLGYAGGTLLCSADCRNLITRNCLVSMEVDQPSTTTTTPETTSTASGAAPEPATVLETGGVGGGGNQQTMSVPPDEGGTGGGGGGSSNYSCISCNNNNLVVNGLVGIGTGNDPLPQYYSLNIKDGNVNIYRDFNYDGQNIILRTKDCRYGYFDMYYDRLRYITNDADPSENTESMKFFIENDGSVGVKKITSTNSNGDVVIKLGATNLLPSNAQGSGQTGCDYEGYTGQAGQGGGAG